MNMADKNTAKINAGISNRPENNKLQQTAFGFRKQNDDITRLSKQLHTTKINSSKRALPVFTDCARPMSKRPKRDEGMELVDKLRLKVMDLEQEIDGLAKRLLAQENQY